MARRARRLRLLGALLAGLAAGALPARHADNGDGTYTNPPLYADYPDPDIIRVGDDFYFATTTFVNTPGLTLLHSQDLVNWDILSHVIPRLEGRPEYNLEGGTAYRHGVFAPSLRHHDGVFYVVVTPVGQNTRIYRAPAPTGPWTATELDRAAFDPGFFIDDDGIGYIATSGGWDGTVTLLTLNADFTAVVDSQEIFHNPGAEGSKVLRRGDWYYMFHSIPSRLALTCSRARSLLGPWETIPQIDDRTGGHQGALVDLPDGSWYGFVMVDAGAIGRMTNISPVFWQDDWPVWGTPDAPGRVPATAVKPIPGHALRSPPTSDDFDRDVLGRQWQWNHNPDDTRWSLSERPGFLRLKATRAESFWTARNTLTQKGQGPWSRGEITLDLTHLAVGDVCGFGTLGKINGHIAVTREASGALRLSRHVINDGVGATSDVPERTYTGTQLHLRTDLDFRTSTATCAYSADGATWQTLGAPFPIAFDWRTGTFQGEQFAIFCYNPEPSAGFVDVDSFRFTADPVAADAGQQVLLRGIGPSLQPFGVAQPLGDPRLTRYAGADAVEANEDWSDAPNAATVAATTQHLGAFALPAGSRDAALLAAYSPGPYTVHLNGAADDAGVALLEVYNTAADSARLVNLSARAWAGTGEKVLIAGFAVAGAGAQTLLIRAVGPSLAQFDVPGPLPDPQLTLFEGDTAILSNDDWTTTADRDGLVQATARSGAFALAADSRDAALLVTLMPGTYTAQASGVGGATGNVLVEVYAVP